MSLHKALVSFLDEPKHLKEAYGEFPDYPEHSIRARLSEGVGSCFKKIKKGVYLATSGETQALIIEGDAWKEIKCIGTDTIDFIITDSPYTTVNKWAKMGTTRKKKGTMEFATKDMNEELYTELHRVLKKGGHCFLFFSADSEHTIDYNNNQLVLAKKTGFTFNKRFIWDKLRIGMGYNGRCRYEQIFFLSKGKRHKPYDLSIPDVLAHKAAHHTKRIHETEKPVELIKDLLKFCAKKNDVGLDLFAGSYNFVQACQEHQCHSISIDIDKKYTLAAVNRFNAKEVKCRVV